MKKILFVAALLISVGTTSAFANDEKVSPRVLKSFNSEFSYAQDVQWEVGENYSRAAFTMNEQRVFAYYNTEGELLSIGRYISTLQLPINLFSDLKNDYSKFWVSDLFEISNGDGVHYYATLETADTKLVVHSSNGSKWSTHNKSKKI